MKCLICGKESGSGVTDSSDENAFVCHKCFFSSPEWERIREEAKPSLGVRALFWLSVVFLIIVVLAFVVEILNGLGVI